MADDTKPAPAVRPKGPPTTAQWWRADEMGAEPHQVVAGVLRTIRTQQSARYEAMRRWMEIYGADLSAMGFESNHNAYADRLEVNELAATIDTLHSQIFKNRIVPSPATTGGDWQAQQRAKQLGRWLDGVYDEAEVFSKVMPLAGLYALVTGTGVIKTGSDEDEHGETRLTAHCIPSTDCYVDLAEARNGCPRSFFHDMPVDRYVLLEKFGVADDRYYGSRAHRAEAIEKCSPRTDENSLYAWDQTGDQLRVTFGWHLPSGPNAKDGRYFVGINGCTLVHLPWHRPRFPLSFVRWGLPMAGFWGESAVARIAPLQREYDRLNERIQAAVELMGVPRIIVGKNAGIRLQHIDDVIGSIIQADDINGIKEWDAMPMHPQVFEHRASLPQSMRGILGVSGFSSQGDVPAGLKQASGVALERFEDVEQARQAMLHRSYEAACIDLAECFIDEATDLAEDGIDVQVRARSRTSVEPIKWSEVQTDRKLYVLRVPPASALPKTPAAKQQRLVELLDRGAISLTSFRRLSEIGDVDSANDLDTSDEDIILRNLTRIAEKGEYAAPISLDNLALSKTIAGRFYNWARVHDVPDDRLALVSQYIDEVIALEQRAAKPAAPAPMGPPGMPPDMGPPPGPEGMPPPGPEAMPPPDMGAPPGGMAA